MTEWLIGAGLLALIATWAVSDWRAKARVLKHERKAAENAEKADEVHRDVDSLSDTDVTDELRDDWTR